MFNAPHTGVGGFDWRDRVREMSRVRPPCLGKDLALDRKLHPTLSGVEWKEIVSYPWQREEHINVLEFRALDTAVRWVLSHPCATGARVVSWCDSMVVMFAVRKGRTSAFKLLRRMRA